MTREDIAEVIARHCWIDVRRALPAADALIEAGLVAVNGAGRCEHCRQAFEQTRKDRRFCSNTCRAYAHQHRRTG